MQDALHNKRRMFKRERERETKEPCEKGGLGWVEGKDGGGQDDARTWLINPRASPSSAL